ncbi:hypothetical protein GBF35_37445 [Nonomuraea phyllanthi]|nr:hypothetical protein GBF35_37445 [Nonomuraea phyllanthi]
MLADRLPRLSIIVACQSVCAVCQLVASVLVLTDAASVWSLAGLEMLVGAAGAFFQPAVKGMVPQLVPPGPMLVQANALLQIANQRRGYQSDQGWSLARLAGISAAAPSRVRTVCIRTGLFSMCPCATAQLYSGRNAASSRSHFTPEIRRGLSLDRRRQAS